METTGLPRAVSVWLLAGVVSAGTARAEPPAPQSSPAEISGRGQVVSASAELLTVDVQDVSVAQLLEEIARQSDLVVRGDELLSGHVTVKLSEVPFVRGVRSILRDRNFGLVCRRAVIDGESLGCAQRELWIFPHPNSESRWTIPVRKDQGALYSDSEVARLLTVLETSDDAWEKEDAILALVGSGRRDVASPMSRRALLDDEQSVRLSAVYALAELGGDESAEALVEALDDRDQQVRLAAVEALGSIGGHAATAVLEYARTNDQSESVKAMASAILDRMVMPVSRHEPPDRVPVP